MQDVLKSRLEPTGRTVRTPEQIPTMRAMLAKRKNKCIHCHDVKVASLRHLRNQDKLQRHMVFTYPTAANLGITVSPDRQSVIRTVKPGTPAARAGVRRGDTILRAGDHRVLTLGDLSHVLEKTADPGRLSLELKRNGRAIPVRLDLKAGWRKSTDPSWRESLHVVGPNCGLWGRRLNANERRRLKLAPGKLALKVTFLWGPHTRKAGIRVGDIIVRLDGQAGHDHQAVECSSHAQQGVGRHDPDRAQTKRSGTDRPNDIPAATGRLDRPRRIAPGRSSRLPRQPGDICQCADSTEYLSSISRFFFR